MPSLEKKRARKGGGFRRILPVVILSERPGKRGGGGTSLNGIPRGAFYGLIVGRRKEKKKGGR